MAIYRDHYSPYCPWHIFYYVIDSIHTVRHVKIIIISYRWLNVETKERLFSVRKCREQWRGTATHGLLKRPGPESFTSFFSKPVSCVTHYFSEFFKRADEYFPSFAPIQVLTDFSGLNGLTFIFTVSRARSSWPGGRYPTGWICSNGFLYSRHH